MLHIVCLCTLYAYKFVYGISEGTITPIVEKNVENQTFLISPILVLIPE